MSPRNEVFQAMPFDASSDASEPLITAGGDAEEEDHRLQEKVFSRFKISYGLLGLLVGSIIGGALVDASIVWTMAALHLGTRAQTMYSHVTLLVVAFFWRKIMVMCFATDIKPSSSRRSMMDV
jgi:hypothetical protein